MIGPIINSRHRADHIILIFGDSSDGFHHDGQNHQAIGESGENC